VSEKQREDHDAVIDGDRARKAVRAPSAKSAEKERLAAALRENLKRRKAQVSARRNGAAPE